jgi:hypothetical protein
VQPNPEFLSPESHMSLASIAQNLVVFVDIDDTIVRSFGSKRLPMTAVIRHVRDLHHQGAVLYAWSSAGADYARSTAIELGLAECFVAFLPKPHVLLDDQRVSEWRRTMEVHPNTCAGRSVDDYRREIETGATR